jgi:hypothetical protein
MSTASIVSTVALCTLLPMGLTVGSCYLLFRCFKTKSSGTFNVYFIADAFDSDCVALWRTQIRALQLLYDHGREAVAIADICAAYTHAARRFPELYEGIKFEQWYEFLKAQGVVATDGRFATLTPIGSDLVAVVSASTDVRNAGR